jgi:uncharacterized protein YecE (DUF72 family)
MAEQEQNEGQLTLFDDEPSGGRAARVGCAKVPPEVESLARRLPPTLFLGTSSWSFPGWVGIVYDRKASERDLAREGLAAYAKHPLLRTVGLDRTYWAPIPAETFAAYASVVPDEFRFVVKAHAACTSPRMSWLGESVARRREPNPLFLDPVHAAQEVVGPCVEGLGAKAGPILFQFPPLAVADFESPGRFASRLHEFLERLPRGPLYAVELRNAQLLFKQTYAAFAATGAEPCFNVHPSVPGIAQQREYTGGALPRTLVIRWMLHRKLTYEGAKDRHRPFDRIVDEDELSRAEIAGLCIEALQAGRTAFVIANNKAEGSAPLSLIGLAERLGYR